jgi:hypothetical protein
MGGGEEASVPVADLFLLVALPVANPVLGR